MVLGQTTYTWNQTGTASWALDINWTPARTTPAATDILVFNNGATTTATNVPTQTIGSLQVSSSTKLTLSSSGVTVTLTIGNGVTGADLTVASGCQLNIAQVTNANTLTMSVATTATGSISGSMDFSSATSTTPNQLLAADASGITFNSGAVFTQNTNNTGAIFGGSGTGKVIFTSGATFIQNFGSNPNAGTVTTFQTGSLYKFTVAQAPGLSGRTYANFEYANGSSQTGTGGSACVMDNLTVTSGTFNFNVTGIPGHAIKGNISIASGATLNFNSLTAARISLNGSSVQTISNLGAFSVSSLDTILLTHATNTILSQNGSGNFSFAGVIRSFSGTTPLTITGAGSGRIDIINFNNSFTGTIALTGTETRFSRPGCFGNASNTIVIDGGRLATASDSTYTIASSHNIQVSNAAGSAISVTTSGVLTYNGVISDKPSTTGMLVKQGAGTLALGGVSTYTGATTINQALLQLTTGNDRLPTTTTLNMGQAASANLGTLDLNGFNQSIAGINSIAGTNGTASNNIINSTAAATLTINGSGNYAYGDGLTNTNSGIITGAISIIKSGSGTQTFSDANTYTGTTSVNQGKLVINGAQTGTGAVSIASGATLSGSGILPGTVSLSGIISPGNSPGTITTGAFTFNANSTYSFEISNATGSAGTDWDKIVSTGAIDVSASPITIDLTSLSIVNFNNMLPYTWIIAHGTSITGFNAANFTINAANFLPPLGGGSFSVTQTGIDINIVFSPVAPPILTLPTATSITAMDALLGATIINDGGSMITERGTVYKTSAGVTSADNPLAEGGTSTGAFSHLRNGLNPETQYFYAGYATNSSGIGLSAEANFRTLSNPPVSEVTNFAATPFSSSQIDLTWTVASFPGSGATANGYIILRRQDATDPTTTGITNAIAPSSLSLPSGTTLVTTIISGSTNNFTNTSLTSSTQYNYIVVPFTWDGTNAATYNYYLSNAPTANATTFAGLPIVTSPTVTNISSTTADLGANVTSNGGNTLTERGTVYNTTTGVTINDNPLAEGGISTGVFSHTRNALTPETQYFFKGYAINSNGSALSSESNFYTFSAPPTSEATGFSGTPMSTSEIDLSWTSATFPGMGATATGYVVLRRSDLSNPTTSGFVNGMNPSSLTFPAGTTLVATITSGATITYNDTGLSTPGGQYNYLIVPFTWDNVHAVTYDYYLANPATTFSNTLPGIPLLNMPTVTAVTESSAILGANITSNSGGTLTERGTVYKTSTPVASTDNPLAEGGTGIGIFSHTRNSLLPQTQYFFAGYATNAGGTGLSSEGSFRTWSNPPLSEVTNFVATPFSSSQVDLTWTAANFPGSGATATGYIILRKTGSNPATTGIVNATAPASLSFPAGTTLVTTITTGATAMYSNTGLLGSTQYNYLIVPFTWDGTNTSTYNYYLNNAPTANATTAAAPPIVWTATSGVTAWYTAANWTPSTTAAAWLSNDIAQFQNNGTANNAGINMNTGGLTIGAIEVTSARTTNNLLIGNSVNTNGTITLNGAAVNSNPNTILRNGSIKNFTVQDANGGTGLMTVVLGNTTNNKIYLDGAGNITISSIITGTSKLLSLNGVGAGVLTLSGINTYSGGFTLNAGTVSATTDAAFGTGIITLNGGSFGSTGTRAITNNITVGGNFSLSGTGAATLSGTLDLGNFSRTITNSTTSGSRIFSGIVSGASGSGMTFNGTGSGPIYLGASNTFIGDININGAEVGFAGNAALGDVNNTIILDGGRITSSTTAAGAITALWSTTHAIQLGATTGTSINVQSSSGDLTYNGIFSDKPSSTGILVKQGAGILRLGGVSIYSGATSINSGTLQLTTDNNRLPIGTTLNLGQTASANLGTFDLNSFNQELSGLNSIAGTNGTTGNNNITSTGASTLTLSGSGSYNYGDGTNTNSGVITGAISIIKNGSGTQTLGDANTYSGTTSINQGSLIINGVQTGTGAVTVASGATLGGSGTIPGAISISGIISPGNSPGIINTGAFTFNANTTYKFEINNATGVAGTNWDKINSSGVIDVAASPITIDLTSLSITNFDNSSSYTWIIATGSSITGFNPANFIINTTNFLPPLAGGSFSITQTGNDLSIVYASSGVPVLIAPTSAAISNIDAILGATITTQGSSALTARGTVYKTSPGVTATDNPLAEGGTSIGVYSHLRNALSPETQYFYAGYATNNSFTGLSAEANFRTLSNPPTSEATAFSATTISATQIDLNWTVASFPGSGASANGYILLRREDATNPTTSGIVNAVAPASLTLPLGTTLVTTFTSGSTNTFSNTGLMANTPYNYLIVPFTWDGVNAATYNYYLPNAPAANAMTLPFVPTLNNPTVTSITENTAILGATVVTNNGSTLTERGTVYKTSSPVAATDNPLAEGGISVGTFTHTRSSLSPETQYFFAGYAINGGGTGMSGEGNFWTLSNSPTSAATNFLAIAFSATQIDLTWTVANFPMSGASASGYIILRKDGIDPTTSGIVDATAPASLSLPGGTTLVTTITTGATNNYSNTGLLAATQYNYLIVPFTWDGVNAATYNYYLANAPTSNATTQYFKQTFAADGSAFSTSKWSTPSSTSCDIANQTNAFTSGNVAYFCTPSGTGTGAALTVAGITATESFSLTSAANTINNVNNGVIIIDIASGKSVDFITQPFSSQATAGYIKNGGGAFAFSGGAYGGGFTLNAGTIIAKNVNAFGLNATSGLLNLNNGTLAASASLNFSNKFSAINFGGDIQFESTTTPANGASTLTFNTAMFLGSPMRTLTLGGSGAVVFGGVISNTSSNGITFTANNSGTGRFDVTNASNTFTGPININGDGGNGVAEVRFTIDGSFGNTTNTININGGRLATLSGASYTLIATRGIQVGNTAGTSISTPGAGTLTYNGVISDLMGATPGSWVKQGSGTLSLGGVSTYTGSTTINSGTIVLNTGNNRLPSGTTLIIGQAGSANLGTFNLNGFNQQVAGINSITGTNATSNNNTITSVNPGTLTIGGSGTYTFGDGSNANSGIISGAISLVKSGTGLQTLGDVNTYTGNTTITDGELRWNPSSDLLLNGSMIMNGGIFGTTGISDMLFLTFGSFDLSENSKMDLSTASDHTITFSVAGTFTSGKTLTIYGWQGVAGMSGTKGKIFFGNSAAALTADQLAQILFNDGTIGSPGVYYSAVILSTGEVVEGVAGCGAVVLNTNNSGSGSLRDVIACVAPGTTITFDASLMGATITLTTGEIEIDKSLTISGLGNVADIKLSGNSASRIFHVQSGKTLSLQNLTLQNANAASPFGGAVYVQGNLTLQNMLLQNNFENGITPKGISVNSPGGVITVIGSNVQVKE